MNRTLAVGVALLWLSPSGAWADDAPAKPPVEDLIKALSSSDEKARRDAVQELGKQRAVAAVDALSKTVREDSAVEVRTRAAHSLGTIGSASAVAALRASVETDADGRVRHMAAWALGRLGDMAGVHSLSRALQNDKVPSVRSQAAKSLGKVGDKGAVPALTQALKDDAEEVRTAAIVALQSLGVSNQEIRRNLPAAASAAAGEIVAEKKSLGVGAALGVLTGGLGLVYAGKKAAGAALFGLEVVGWGLAAVGMANGAFKDRLVCNGVTLAEGQTCLPPAPGAELDLRREAEKPGMRTLAFIGITLGLVTHLVGTIWSPIAVNQQNKRVDSARTSFRLRPVLDLSVTGGSVGVHLEF